MFINNVKYNLYYMSGKISYSPLEADLKKITDLVKKERYRNAESFLDKAVQVMLTWESKNPERCMDIMKTMTPFTREQEIFMNQILKEEEKAKHFGDGDYLSEAIKEVQSQEAFSPSRQDHLRLRRNLDASRAYVKKLTMTSPASNRIYYDGYPILFRFYSRILPAKIVLTALGDILRDIDHFRVDLKIFRLKAYDIANEISEEIQRYEIANNKKRNEKISTGLPKVGEDDELERKARMQKRFKEQYVGKLRRNRKTGQKHFEGALIALELIRIEEEDGELFISFTEKGRKFYLMDNPVINGDYSRPLSEEEQGFICGELLPNLRLEYRYMQTALRVIKEHKGKRNIKITDVLDREFFVELRNYAQENPEEKEYYEFDVPQIMDDVWKKYIMGQRVATMGRMAELSLVKWEINDAGDSVFTIPEKPLLQSESGTNGPADRYQNRPLNNPSILSQD